MALRNIAAAAAGLALLVAPSVAQTTQAAVKSPNDLNDAQMNELYCIYDEMAKSPEAVAESIISGNKEAVAKARAIQEAARTVCVTKYQWSVEQAAVAGAVATSGILADMSETELRGRGLSDKTLEAVMQVVDKLTSADFDAMLSMGQKKADEAALQRVRKHLTDAGVPNDRDTLEVAIAFLQGSMAEYRGVLRWVDAKYY